MITMYRIYMYLLAACLLLGVTACEEEGLGNEETPFAPYVLSLGTIPMGLPLIMWLLHPN